MNIGGIRALTSRCLAIAVGVSCTLAACHGPTHRAVRTSPDAMTPARPPEAPQQHAPWRPSAASDFTRAVAWLFDHGITDPRGLAYVRVRVHSHSEDGGPSREAHGWLLPRGVGQPGDPWWLDWSGRLVEHAEVIGPADLAADLAPMRPGHDGGGPDGESSIYFRPRPGEPFELYPMAAVLLARLGNAVDFKLYWWRSGVEAYVANVVQPIFRLAVLAHELGDDALTLREATIAADLYDAFLRDFRDAPDGGIDRLARPMSFARPARTLARDAARRLEHAAAHRARVLRVGADGGIAPSPATSPREAIDMRVRDLIEALEDVDARQWFQPGWVLLERDPRVIALEEIGDPAVEPLLDVLEHDTRLTRSFQCRRDYDPERYPIGVAEAAYTALATILQEGQFFTPDSTSDVLTSHDDATRRAIARTMRERWNRIRGLSPADRLYAILADDAVGAEGWSVAARNLVRDRRTRLPIRSSLDGFVPGDAEPATFVGEPLRRERPGAVESLLRRRIDQVIPPRASRAAGSRTAAQGDIDATSLRDGCAMIAALIRWSPDLPDRDALGVRAAAMSAGSWLDGEACMALLRDVGLRVAPDAGRQGGVQGGPGRRQGSSRAEQQGE